MVMNGRGRSGRAGVVLGTAAGLSLAGLLSAVALRSARDARGIDHRPEPVTARPALESVAVPGALAVRDFDSDGGHLYLLDPLTPAVWVLRRAGGQWQPAGTFGRRGGGPGEFSAPTGIALLRDGRVAVAEPGRIHFFTGAGEYLESIAPQLACAVPLPQVAGGRSGVFIHGSCLRRGGVTDTMSVVLFWTSDGSTVRTVATDARFTTDGSFGTAYGADAGFSDGMTHHLFGAGSSACVYRVSETDSGPVARRTCDDGLRPFRLRLAARTRAALEARRRRSPQAADALRIPGVHPPYVERVVLGTGDAWLRGWSEDSLVLRLVGTQRDVAVLPYQGLLACRRMACLWAENAGAGVRVRLLPLGVLDSLTRAGRGAGGRGER